MAFLSIAFAQLDFEFINSKNQETGRVNCSQTVFNAANELNGISLSASRKDYFLLIYHHVNNWSVDNAFMPTQKIADEKVIITFSAHEKLVLEPEIVSGEMGLNAEIAMLFANKDLVNKILSSKNDLTLRFEGPNSNQEFTIHHSVISLLAEEFGKECLNLNITQPQNLNQDIDLDAIQKYFDHNQIIYTQQGSGSYISFYFTPTRPWRITFKSNSPFTLSLYNSQQQKIKILNPGEINSDIGSFTIHIDTSPISLWQLTVQNAYENKLVSSPMIDFVLTAQHCQVAWRGDIGMLDFCMKIQMGSKLSLDLLQAIHGGIPISDFNKILDSCKADWLGDYEMQVKCLEEQITNYGLLKIGVTVPNANPSNSESQAIRQTCASEWQGDFTMQVFCQERTLEALAYIKTPGSNINRSSWQHSLNECAREWGDSNYLIQEYCLKKTFQLQ